jgi:Zn finger protein HypA/HybF involved in hydrogenase expression
MSAIITFEETKNQLGFICPHCGMKTAHSVSGSLFSSDEGGDNYFVACSSCLWTWEITIPHSPDLTINIALEEIDKVCPVCHEHYDYLSEDKDGICYDCFLDQNPEAIDEGNS